MILRKYFEIAILLLTYIRQTISCNSSTLVGCLVQNNENTLYQIQSKIGYGYGFWFQFLSTNKYNLINLEGSRQIDGSILLRESDYSNSMRLMFYYDMLNNNTNNEKHLYFKTIRDDTLLQIIKITYNSFTFEGSWIYVYISYQFPNQGQILLYDLTNNEYQGTKYKSKQDMTTQEITLKQQTKLKLDLKPSYESNLYYYFPGRISKIQFNQNNDGFIFQTATQFQSYLHQQFIPQPFCQVVTYDSPIIQNYEYIFGLIHMESWVKINYAQNINQSVSFFGVDLQNLKTSILYQKLQIYNIMLFKHGNRNQSMEYIFKHFLKLNLNINSMEINFII